VISLKPSDLLEDYGKPRDRLADVSVASDVFNREFGSQLTAWEYRFHQEFRQKLNGRRVRYKGFVRHTTNDSVFLLSPSPYMLGGVFVYLYEDQELPPDGAIVEVEGSNIAVPSLLQRSDETVRAISADALETVDFNLLSEIEPPMSLKNLSRLLFKDVGMAEASKRVFARLFVSSPPFQDAVGGLATGIQAIASKKQVRRLFSFMKKAIPRTLRGSWPVTKDVRGMRVATPDRWRLDVGTTNKSKIRKLCVDRVDPSGFREVSIGALTNSETGALPDVPLALATEDFWVESTDAERLSLPILKSSITYQLLTPQISEDAIESATEHVVSRLQLLRDSFGFDRSILGRGHLLDADRMGRPLSTIRLARSTARANWDTDVTAKDLKRAWDNVLEPALKEFAEIAALREGAETDWGKGRPLHRYNTKVHRALRKLDTGKTTSLGPTLEKIAEEAGVDVQKAARTLEEMKKDAVVYEPRSGRYRLV